MLSIRHTAYSIQPSSTCDEHGTSCTQIIINKRGTSDEKVRKVREPKTRQREDELQSLGADTSGGGGPTIFSNLFVFLFFLFFCPPGAERASTSAGASASSGFDWHIHIHRYILRGHGYSYSHIPAGNRRNTGQAAR